MTRFIFLILLTIANIAYASPADGDDLERRINELTDKIEQLTHQNNLLQKKIENLSVDMDFRLKEMENKKPVIEAKPELEDKKPEKNDPKLIKAEFDKAYGLLKEQKYEEAEHALNQFVKHYPKNEYCGNAYYWLGESFTLRKKYNEAAINYIHSFNKFPQNSKADLSMLKLASALNMLGKKKEACATLSKLKAKDANLTPALHKMLEKEMGKIQCKTSVKK